MRKNLVVNFMDKKFILPKIIVIYGPTACGKTGMSIQVAKLINGEVIGADSRQIYRGMDIGTGKIKENEKEGIKHYMIDIIDPTSDFSVAEFKKQSEDIINNLHNNDIIPIICGGTGLYLDSIVYNFEIPEIKPDWEYREKLEKIRQEKGNEYLWQMLNDLDSNYAKDLSPNNFRYIIRGLEVLKETGESKLSLKRKKELKYDVLFLTPYDGDRQKLYNKINLRIEEMFNEGLIDEVKTLLQIYPQTSFGLNAIGYREVISFLNNEITLNECKELVKQHNRNYAKRQLTWFKKYENNASN